MSWNLKGISEMGKKEFQCFLGGAQHNDFQGQETAFLTHCLLSIMAH